MELEYGSWKIAKELGHGSYGSVYEIEQTDDLGFRTRAALKIIHIPKEAAEVDTLRSTGMNDLDITNYFHGVATDSAAEIELLSRMQGNSNIVNYQAHTIKRHKDGFGWDIYIQMELLTSLTKYLVNRRMNKKQVVQLGIDICSALERCQKNHIIHRDIKPDNIFVSEQGDYKLGDFGIARIQEHSRSNMTQIGTPSYMAPEIVKQSSYDSRVDIYSLGIVLYQLLNNNQLPLMPTNPAEIQTNSKEKAVKCRLDGALLPAPINADKNLSEIILKACAYEPDDRYSTPTQMKRALEAVLAGKEIEVIPPPSSSPPKPIALICAMIVLLVMAIGVWVFVGGRMLADSNAKQGISYSLKNHVLTITGSGAMENYSSESLAPWAGEAADIVEVIIDDGVTSIGSYSFANCDKIKKVSIANSIVEISEGAFANCASLERIDMPDSIEVIGTRAFWLCNSLGEVNFSDNLKEIGDSAFNGCASIKQIYLPSQTEEVGDAAFWGCTSLVEFQVASENASYMESNGILFDKEMSALLCYPEGKKDTVYAVPDGVQTIGNYAFSYCNNLVSIELSDSISQIGSRAFYVCNSLESVYFVGDAPISSADTFEETSVTVYYPKSNNTWTDEVKKDYAGTISWIEIA